MEGYKLTGSETGKKLFQNYSPLAILTSDFNIQ
jgi:hypothetical protein